MGTAVPTYLPHFSLLYTGSAVGAAEAPAPLPSMSFIMRAAGSFASARNPAPLPSFSGIMGPASAYSLTIASGTYTVTGGNVEADYQMAAVKGMYTLAGVTVALKRGYTLAMVSGSYGLQGQTVQLVRGLKMSIVKGTYTLSGVAVQLVYSTAKTMFFASGTYALTGNALAFRRTYVMACESGTYTLAGQDLAFSYIEAQHFFVPYLIGAMEDSALAMIAAIYGAPVVVGTGGTVVSQAPEHMTVVLRGQTVTITMGGAVYTPISGRRRGLPPYTRGC